MKQYQLHLKGYVGGSDFSSEAVQAILSANPDAEVSVLVDSTGGQLATALSISSAFRRHGKVHVHFAGMNASAATIASLGAAHISMDASALYLVHKCSMGVFEWASMNADQLQEYIKDLAKQKMDLEKMDSNVAAMYAAKCKKSQVELLDLMQKGGWMTSSEALEWGFVDEVTDYAEDEIPTMTAALATAMAAADMPIPDIPYSAPPSQMQSAAGNEPLFARFMAAIASLFHSQGKRKEETEGTEELSAEDNTDTNNDNLNLNAQKNMTHYANIEAALQVEGFTPDNEGAVLLTQVQMNALESLLAENAGQLKTAQEKATQLQTQVDALTAENEALKETPADSSTTVVNGKTDAKQEQQPKTQEQAYVETLKSAKNLYDLFS